MMEKTQPWRNAAILLMLGTIALPVLFLALRPLQVESPASSGARAMLRLDSALGATVEPVDATIARQEGLSPKDGYLVVTSIASRGPAASAGLRVGDVIEQIGGKPADQMQGVTQAAMPVSIWRGGKETIVNVQFGSSGRG